MPNCQRLVDVQVVIIHRTYLAFALLPHGARNIAHTLEEFSRRARLSQTSFAAIAASVFRARWSPPTSRRSTRCTIGYSLASTACPRTFRPCTYCLNVRRNIQRAHGLTRCLFPRSPRFLYLQGSAFAVQTQPLQAKGRKGHQAADIWPHAVVSIVREAVREQSTTAAVPRTAAWALSLAALTLPGPSARCLRLPSRASLPLLLAASVPTSWSPWWPAWTAMASLTFAQWT
jgi:hypothetical protein